MDDELKYPYLMHKRTLFHVPNNRETREKFGNEFVPITAEQAVALSKDRPKAGMEIMRSVVAADNAAAFAEAQARLSKPEELTPAEPPRAAAPEPAPAVPAQGASAWGAVKKAK